MATSLKAPAKAIAGHGTALIRRSTLWRPSQQPEVVDPRSPVGEGIRWLEVDVVRAALVPEEAREAAADLRALLSPACRDQLDEEMAADLLNVADRREGERYSQGTIRSVSSFQVHTERLTAEQNGKTIGIGGQLMLDPVEFLAGDGWLITAWHPRRTTTGPEPVRFRGHDLVCEGVMV